MQNLFDIKIVIFSNKIMFQFNSILVEKFYIS